MSESRDREREGEGSGVSEDNLLGQTLDGRYRVVRRLGRGGMGVVYLGEQLNLGREVCIKVIAPERVGSEAIAARFRTEAEIVAHLDHPNTLKLFDFGEMSDGRLYLVTERLRGRSLGEAILEGRLSALRTLEILRDVCRALAEAHGAGVIHRDLKPSNIFLSEVGGEKVVKVLDFGVAKMAHRETSETLEGVVIGTPDYMSPEQARGAKVDARSDLYSLGVVGYRAIAGVLPFVSDSDDPLVGHLFHAPRPFSLVSPPMVVDRRVEDLIFGLLAKSPNDRPFSAEHVAREIELCLETLRAPTIQPEFPGKEASGTPTSTSRVSAARTASASVPAPTLGEKNPSPRRWVFALGSGAAVAVMTVAMMFAFVGGRLSGCERPREIPRVTEPVSALSPVIHDVEVLPSDPEGRLESAARKLEPGLIACHLRALGGRASGMLRLRFVLTGTSAEVAVRPLDEISARFRACVIEDDLRPLSDPHGPAIRGLRVVTIHFGTPDQRQ